MRDLGRLSWPKPGQAKPTNDVKVVLVFPSLTFEMQKQLAMQLMGNNPIKGDLVDIQLIFILETNGFSGLWIVVRVELAYLYEPLHWAKMWRRGWMGEGGREVGKAASSFLAYMRCYPSEQAGAMLACLRRVSGSLGALYSAGEREENRGRDRVREGVCAAGVVETSSALCMLLPLIPSPLPAHSHTQTRDFF